MIRGIAYAGLCLVLAVACIRSANAMDPKPLMSQYVRDRWGSDRGLQGEVYSITQTPDGYLWIGTDKGLWRFDGQVFLPVVGKDQSGLTITHVLGVAVDSQGSLIARLRERNLLRYANGVFENTLLSLQPRELAITAMASANDGTLLVSGLTNGTLRYSDGRFATIMPVSALPSSPVISLAESPDGKIWLGTRDAGLFYVEQGRVTAVKKGLPSNKINSLLAIGADVWIGTDAGVARWNGTEITRDGVPPALQRAPAVTMLSDRRSNLWIGTKTGLLRANGRGVASLGELESYSPGVVNTLFEDREGNLWSGGPWGIQRLSEGSFKTYGRTENLPSDHIGAVFADSLGRIWFAPLEGGLFWLDAEHLGRVTEAGLDNDVVYSIAGASDGVVVGRQRGGVTRLRWKGQRLIAENYGVVAGLPENSVYSVYQSRDGSVWAGTLSRGVSRIEAGGITTYSTEAGLASNTVNSILEDADGTMWFATPKGLSALSNGKWRRYDIKGGLPSDEVNCLEQDARGLLWIGTSGGLAFLSADEIRTPQQPLQALHDQVLGIAEDRTGWLWIVTSKEVVRVNRDRLLRGALAYGDVREYEIEDGLRSLEGVKRSRSVVLDPIGRIWMSMSIGLSVVDPARLADNASPVMSNVVSVSADGSPIDFRSVAKVAIPPRRVTIVYSGLSLRYPARLRFRYELEGYDTDWSEPTAAREASYTNLGPGSYRFHLVASNPDGVWNTAESSVGLEIAPLFWQTWWFRLGIGSICGFGVLLLYRMRLHHLRAELNLRFDERLKERTRIAGDLHDTLLQSVQGLVLKFHAIVQQMPREGPLRDSMEKALDQADQVLAEGRNAIQGLRSSDGALLDLPEAFWRIRDELVLEDGVEFRVIVEGHPRRLHPVLRDEVYRIGREALVNAARHSRAKGIEVELEYSHKHLRVLVRDDGRGIDDSRVLRFGRQGHWGLPGMYERAERIGGRLSIWSSASAGTEVELSVPGLVAYESKSSNAFRRWLAVWSQWRRFLTRL